MKKILLPILVLILAACSSSPQVTATRLANVTVTSPPAATVVIPTPTLHPQFVELQIQIATGERFTLLPNGTIQETTSEGVKTISGLTVEKDGSYTLMVNGEAVTLKSSDVTFDDENGVQIKGYELDENGEWLVAEEPIKEFPICKDFTKFADFPVAFSDLQEQARFVQSTLTAELFDPEKINFEPMTTMSELRSADGAKHLVPNVDTAPNYEAEGSAPFLKEFMCGITEVDGEKYVTIQVPQHIEGVDPQQLPVMTGVYELRSDLKGAWPNVINRFVNGMNIVPWNITDLSLATQFPNPQTGENFTLAEVQAIVEEMKQGNFANTHGLVLKFDIARNSGHWYE